MDEGVLTEVLHEARFGAGWRALDEAGLDSGFGAGVAEEEVLDNLLDAPLVDVQRGMELGLGVVETAEGAGESAMESLQIGVDVGIHVCRITLHRLRKRG